MRQKRILLAFIKAVHLVDKHKRGFAGCSHMGFGSLHGLTDFFDAGEYRADRDKREPKGIGHQARQRRLSHPGRPPENHRVRPVRFKRHSQRLPRPQKFLLTDHLINRTGPQTLCQRHHRIFYGRFCTPRSCHRRHCVIAKKITGRHKKRKLLALRLSILTKRRAVRLPLKLSGKEKPPRPF